MALKIHNDPHRELVNYSFDYDEYLNFAAMIFYGPAEQVKNEEHTKLVSR
jgi:hypothetical protein